MCARKGGILYIFSLSSPCEITGDVGHKQEVLHPPHSSSLQSLPSLTPFQLILNALFKASHKGFCDMLQQEPLQEKKIPPFIIPAGEFSAFVLYKTVVYHAQRVFVPH